MQKNHFLLLKQLKKNRKCPALQGAACCAEVPSAKVLGSSPTKGSANLPFFFAKLVKTLAQSH